MEDAKEMERLKNGQIWGRIPHVKTLARTFKKNVSITTRKSELKETALLRVRFRWPWFLK